MNLLKNRGSPLQLAWIAPLAWGAAAAAVGFSAGRLDPNLLEEGIIVHAAERLAAGDHLYRDLIVHTAPLPYEFLALLFRAFDADVMVARVALVVLQSIAAALVFAGARRGGANALAHPTAAAIAAAPAFLFPQLSNYYYTTIALYLALAAIYVGVRGIHSSAWSALAGALVALVALCKQTTGIAFSASFVPTLILLAPRGDRISRAAAVALGSGCVIAATLFSYGLRGDLRAFFYGVVELPLAMGSHFYAPFVNLWPFGELDAAVRQSWDLYAPSLYSLKYGMFETPSPWMVAFTQFLYALPFLALAATLGCAVTARLTPAAWLHSSVLFAMALNVFPRSSWGHLVVALPIAIMQLLLLIPRPGRSSRSSGPRGSPAPALRAAGAVLIAALGMATAGTLVWINSQAGPPHMFGPRIALRAVSPSYKQPAIPRVIGYLRDHTRIDEPIFVARQEPLLYFATDCSNPTPFGGVLPGMRELQEPRILEALKGVRFVVMSDIDQPLYTYFADELPGVQAYLERHYEIPGDFVLDDYSWIVVAARGPDRGPTEIDLVAERTRGRAWIRDRAGSILPATDAPQRLAARQLKRPLPIVLGARGGGIDFELDLPNNAVFQAGVGYRGLVSVDHQYLHPSGLTLSLSIRAAGDFEVLKAVRIDDRPRAGRRWSPFQADLSNYGGQRVTLRLEARAQNLRTPDRLSWWGSPRISRSLVDRSSSLSEPSHKHE